MNKQNRAVLPRWWGIIEFKNSNNIELQCADLSLALSCQGSQWWLSWQWQKQEKLLEPTLAYTDRNAREINFKKQQRFVFARAPEAIELRPVLADRPIVCRPVVDVALPPRQQVTLYACLPLWLQCWVPHQSLPVADVATARVSDTWFGPNTREGVFSYASQLSEQLEVEPVTDGHGYAVIEVQIQNQSDEMLVLDKLSVPVPNLSLYVDASGRFWTPRITLVRRETNDATLTIENEMSCGLNKKDLTLVSAPREDIGGNKITKALSALFG